MKQNIEEVSCLVEGTNFLTSSVTLKVDQCYLVYDKTWMWTLGFFWGRWRRLSRWDVRGGFFHSGLFFVRLNGRGWSLLG